MTYLFTPDADWAHVKKQWLDRATCAPSGGYPNHGYLKLPEVVKCYVGKRSKQKFNIAFKNGRRETTLSWDPANPHFLCTLLRLDLRILHLFELASPMSTVVYRLRSARGGGNTWQLNICL
ncbi:hypothetical protein J6590_054854 [Homalodisca vitripennis]|nr:hypothetical protein J6590_054854 [Homalodisca vitripennis]